MRSEAHNETELERSADGVRRRKPPLFFRTWNGPLVTSAAFAQRIGRGREGERADRKPVERSKGRVGHGEHTI